MRTCTIRLVGLLLLLCGGNALADTMVMARIAMKAELALEYVKSSVEEHGYSIAHIQLCDGGMKEFGYKSDVYRVVFFGKVEEVRQISEKYPEFVSYLPLKMTVVAERDETVLTIVNPKAFAPYYAGNEELQIQFGRWYNDIVSIINDVRKATGQKVALKYSM